MTHLLMNLPTRNAGNPNMSRCYKHISEEAIPATRETVSKNVDLGSYHDSTVRQLPLHSLLTFEMTSEEIEKLCYFYSLGSQ
jgi:hypothetical protein